jgi:predicted RNase H-like nuclease
MPTLADTPTGIELKAYEDALDAIVCAWVAICALEGRAAPFGDDTSLYYVLVSRQHEAGGHLGAPARSRRGA